MLRASGALKKEILFFECWLKALADDPDGKWHAQYAAEARGMFPHHVRGRPGRELIQDYLDFHEKAAKTAPDSLKKIDAILCETFFFKGDVSPDTDCWTGAELDKLSRHYDRTYAGGLCRDFNLLAATKTFEPGDAFRKKLSPDFIKTFRLAQERGLYKASDLQIKYILDYFFEDKGIKKGNVTKEVIDFLSSMRKGNSNLHDFDPNKYLGTEAPGLAKVLLEMDFVMAGQFQLKPILDHARAQKGVLGFGKKERNPAYAEFLAQLILEETHYHQALPMRQIEKKSYCHELFRLVGRHRLSGYIDEKHFDVFGGDFCSVPTSRRMGRK
jgi:hypothetical protein